jgi:hypothetical protein
MASSGLLRQGAIGFMLGGVTWLVLGLSARFGYLQAIPGREDVVLYVVAQLFTAAGLLGSIPCRKRVTVSLERRVST